MNPKHILLIGPVPPPYGGMALQTQALAEMLRADGHSALPFPSNFELPRGLHWLERIPAVRTAVRAALIWPLLWRQMGSTDVVHVLACSWLYFFLTVFPAVTVARIRGKRVVLNYRGGEAREFFRRWGWLAAPVLKAAHVITAPSGFLSEVIQSCFGIPVMIVPNVLDRALFQYRARAEFRPRLLSARHLEKIYDLETILKAFRAVQDRYPDASLWIAGTGSEEERLRSLTSEWNLNNVRYLGSTSQQDLASIYDECDIFINASRVDNFPNALLEASSAGLVIVSSNAGGIPFIYQHEKTALLVEPGDSEGLAKAVEKLVQSPVFAARMAVDAAALVRSCDWIEVSRMLYRAYGFSPPGRRDQRDDELRESRCIAG